MGNCSVSRRFNNQSLQALHVLETNGNKTKEAIKKPVDMKMKKQKVEGIKIYFLLPRDESCVGCFCVLSELCGFLLIDESLSVDIKRKG